MPGITLEYMLGRRRLAKVFTFTSTSGQFQGVPPSQSLKCVRQRRIPELHRRARVGGCAEHAAEWPQPQASKTLSARDWIVSNTTSAWCVPTRILPFVRRCALKPYASTLQAAWLDAQEDGAPVDEVQVSRIAASAPLHVLPPTTGIPLRRALYLACGPHPAPLVQQLLRGGVDSVLGVDVSSSSVSRAAAALPAAVLGNTPGLTRFIVGDAQDVPPFQGPFSVAHLSAGALTHAHDDAEDTLARTALLLAPGGHVVVGVPGGRAAADAASRAASSGCGIVTRPLPDQSTWQHLLAPPLPLTLTSFTDDPDFYCAVLQASLQVCCIHGAKV